MRASLIITTSGISDSAKFDTNETLEETDFLMNQIDGSADKGNNLI